MSGAAVLGGFLGLPFGGTVAEFDCFSLLVAILGSLILLIGYRSYAMRAMA